MGVKRAMQRVKILERQRVREAGTPPNIVIEYDTNDPNDPTGEKAAAELRKRYPNYTGTLIFLPKKEPYE